MVKLALALHSKFRSALRELQLAVEESSKVSVDEAAVAIELMEVEEGSLAEASIVLREPGREEELEDVKEEEYSVEASIDRQERGSAKDFQTGCFFRCRNESML